LSGAFRRLPAPPGRRRMCLAPAGWRNPCNTAPTPQVSQSLLRVQFNTWGEKEPRVANVRRGPSKEHRERAARLCLRPGVRIPRVARQRLCRGAPAALRGGRRPVVRHGTARPASAARRRTKPPPGLHRRVIAGHRTIDCALHHRARRPKRASDTSV
jgi:transposase-like protein